MPFLLLVTMAVITNVGAQLLLKKGALVLGKVTISVAGLSELFSRSVGNIWLVIGLVLFGLSFGVWILILSKVQLNIAYPIVTALNFSLIIIASTFLFKEHFSISQIIGIAVILVGVFLVYPK